MTTARTPTPRERAAARLVVALAAAAVVAYLAWAVKTYVASVVNGDHLSSPDWLAPVVIPGMSIATTAVGFGICYGLRRFAVWLWWALTTAPDAEKPAADEWGMDEARP